MKNVIRVQHLLLDMEQQQKRKHVKSSPEKKTPWLYRHYTSVNFMAKNIFLIIPSWKFHFFLCQNVFKLSSFIFFSISTFLWIKKCTEKNDKKKCFLVWKKFFLFIRMKISLHLKMLKDVISFESQIIFWWFLICRRIEERRWWKCFHRKSSLGENIFTFLWL